MIQAAFFLWLAAPAATVAIPPAQGQVSLSSLQSGDYSSAAFQLAETMMPADSYGAMLEASMITGLRIGFSEGGNSLEKEAPGISAEIEHAVVIAARPIFAKARREVVALYARFYTRTMTTAEIVDLTSFYQSKVGRKAIAIKYAQLSSGKIDSAVFTNEVTTSGDIEKINRDTATDLVSELTAEESQALMELTRKPVFAKLQVLLPQINRLEAEQANAEDPELDAAVTTAMTTVMKRRGLGD